MSLLPIKELVNPTPDIRLIATDVDGTLTQHEKFTASLLEAILKLEQVGIPLVLVTGRSTGWVDALRYYLPVAGAIAENGGVYLGKTGSFQLLSSITDLTAHRQKLADTFHNLKREFPQLQESADNCFRLTDWTFDVMGLSMANIEAIALQCQKWGWSFTYSTVQCHIKPLEQDKAQGLRQVLHQYFPQILPEQVLTIGDSPNDQSLFGHQFPQSVGVANVLVYRDLMENLPRYVTTKSEVEGFCEVVSYLLNTRN